MVYRIFTIVCNIKEHVSETRQGCKPMLQYIVLGSHWSEVVLLQTNEAILNKRHVFFPLSVLGHHSTSFTNSSPLETNWPRS